ncbi:MAG: Gfo/Idh/MocA family oxidoreductase [Candidatus Bathyarchaeia archaeon]
MDKLKVGLIGCGFWGKNHARVYNELENAKLVAVCDIIEERAKNISKKYGCDWYKDIDEFLEKSDLEAISICTPTTTHFQVSSKCIKAGKHLLIEKPIGNNYFEAKNLVELAKKHKVRIMPGHIERFNPVIQKLKELIKEEKLGKIILMLARRLNRWPERIGDIGVVKDSAIHDIDIMRYLLNDEVKEVYAIIGSLIHEFEDYAEILLRFKNNETGFIDANWLTPRKTRTLTVIGSEATVALDYLTQEIVIENSEKAIKPNIKWEEPLYNELKHFVDGIIKNEQFLVTEDDGLKSLEICDSIILSGKERRIIYL